MVQNLYLRASLLAHEFVDSFRLRRRMAHKFVDAERIDRSGFRGIGAGQVSARCHVYAGTRRSSA